jgi:hypothetical protein
MLSIPLYLYATEFLKTISWLGFRNAGKVFIFLSILSLFEFLWFRTKRYRPALEVIESHPENIQGLRRWMYCWTILLCIAESETLFGFAFCMSGKTLRQGLPFYAAGFMLTLWLWPRQP